MDENFAEAIGQVLNELRMTHELTDVTLVSNENKFAVHKTILAASSPYFHHLFTNQNVNAANENLSLTGIETEALRTLLEYIYTGRLLLPSDVDKISDLLKASHQLQVTDFHRDAETELVQAVSNDNYPSLWSVAERHGAAQLAERVEAYVSARLEKLSARKPFAELKPEWLRRVLARASMAEGVQPETCARAMLAWCKADIDDRPTCLSSMLPHVRLKLAPLSFLRDWWTSEPLVQEIPCLREEVRALIKEADSRLGGGGKGQAGPDGASANPKEAKESTPSNISREKIFTRRSNVPRPVSPARSVSSQKTGSPILASHRGFERPSSASPGLVQRHSTLSNSSSPVPSNLRADHEKQNRPSSCTESRPSKIPRACTRQTSSGTPSSPRATSSLHRPFHQRSRSLSSSTVVVGGTPPSHDRSPIAEESLGTLSPQKSVDSDSNKTYSLKDSVSDEDDDLKPAVPSVSTTTRLLKSTGRTNSVGNLRMVKSPPTNTKMAAISGASNFAMASVSMHVFGTDGSDDVSVSEEEIGGGSVSAHRITDDLRTKQEFGEEEEGVLNEAGLSAVSPLSFGAPDGSPVSSELGAAASSCLASTTTSGDKASCSSSTAGPPTSRKKGGSGWTRNALPRRPASAGSRVTEAGHGTTTSAGSWAETVLLIVGKKKSGTVSIRCLNPTKGLWLPVCHVDLGPKSPTTAPTQLAERVGEDGGRRGPASRNCTCPILEGSGSTSIGSTLYLIGGVQEDVEGLSRSPLPSTSVVAVDARPQPRVRRLLPLTRPRVSPGAAILGGRLYAIGGRSEQGKPTNHVERFDVKNNGQWSTVAPLPVPCWELGVATSGGLIFAMGGRWKHEWSHAAYSYDPALDQWTRVDALPAIFRDTYPILASHGEYVYAVRHLNPKGDGYVCYYDPPNSIWSIPRSSGPGAKKILAVLPFKEKFWVVDYSGRLYSYDPGNHRWEPACTFNKFVPCPLYAAMLRMAHD